MQKKQLLSAILLSVVGSALAGSSALAQTSALQIGAELGASVAKINGDGDVDNASRTAPYAGFNLVVQKPGARFGFQSGLLFVPKGATSSGDDSEATFAINYVELPLLLRLSLPMQESKIVPTLLLGGSLAAKASCKITGESGSASASVDCDDSLFEGELDVKTMDVGISGGLEVAIPVGPRFFIAPTLRYTRGLISLFDTDTDKIKNSAFQFGAVFRIRM